MSNKFKFVTTKLVKQRFEIDAETCEEASNYLDHYLDNEEVDNVKLISTEENILSKKEMLYEYKD